MDALRVRKQQEDIFYRTLAHDAFVRKHMTVKKDLFGRRKGRANYTMEFIGGRGLQPAQGIRLYWNSCRPCNAWIEGVVKKNSHLVASGAMVSMSRQSDTSVIEFYFKKPRWM